MSLRDPNRAPTREDVLPALGMTQTELAERLDVSRLTVSELRHERRALSAEMAARIAKLLHTTPDIWLRMQIARTVCEVYQHPERLAGVQPVDKRRLRAA